MEAGILKTAVTGEIDVRAEQLRELSLRIHSTPEVPFEEFKAAGWLTAYLRENGFSIETGICELPTAFRASYGRGKPIIGIVAEYDALPDLGHGCGHNLMAGCAAGVGIACKAAVDRFGGSLIVIGTPAEEIYGAKNTMAERGAFSDLDVAMMVHFETRDIVAPLALAIQNLDVEFFGKPAHAAAHADAGVNALEAMLQSFASINSLRQHIKDSARIHGIITKGGDAVNIVPAYSAATFMLRAEDDDYLDILKQKVINCFVGAATASGARLEYKWGMRSPSLRTDPILARLFKRNMQSLGRKMRLSDSGEAFGSTDFGVVSHMMPSIHPLVAIAPVGVALHTPEFVAASASEAGLRGLLDSAKALSMTVVDLVANPEQIAT